MTNPVIIYQKKLTANGIQWSAEEHNAFAVTVKEIANESTDSTDAANEVIVRIKTYERICKAGDMLELTSEAKSAPSAEAMEITSVTESFKGSKNVQHVKICAR